VGKLNWQAALEVVQGEGFHMTASSLGGTIGRNIRFNTETGEVQLRWLG
jgi:chemotaxis receptor (MCP) glutamine deamidase CheD